MEIKKLVLGPLQTNCYIVINGDNCIIIDPAYDGEKITNFLKQNFLNLKAILLTHGHFDHVGACKYFQNQGIKIYASKIEAKLLKDFPKGFGISKNIIFNVDECLEDEQEIELIGLNIKVIFSSGHTAGSCCYLIENNLFCGDTLFSGGAYGRCDLYSGDICKMQESIKKLLKLDESIKLFSGHGYESTIKAEREYYRDFR